MSPVSRPFRIGTRSTLLASQYAGHLLRLLRSMEARGSIVPLSPPPGAQSSFEALLSEARSARIDLILEGIHELPADLPSDVILTVLPERRSPYDALIGRLAPDWASLPEGALVAASGSRRRAELTRSRLDLQVIPAPADPAAALEFFEGDPRVAALILPASELSWLEREAVITELLPAEVTLPAPGQGALGIVTLGQDGEVEGSIRRLHDARVAACLAAERGFLRQFVGGPDAPISALALWAEPGESASGWIELTGRVVTREGDRFVEGVISEPVNGELEAQGLGERLADDLMAQGAGELLDEMEG